jgi:large subunit ribosomal protein L29
MKTSELREMNAGELEQKARELDDQLFRLRIQKSMGQLESAAKLRPMRRDLARIRTLLKEKGE